MWTTLEMYSICCIGWFMHQNSTVHPSSALMHGSIVNSSIASTVLCINIVILHRQMQFRVLCINIVMRRRQIQCSWVASGFYASTLWYSTGKCSSGVSYINIVMRSRQIQCSWVASGFYASTLWYSTGKCSSGVSYINIVMRSRQIQCSWVASGFYASTFQPLVRATTTHWARNWCAQINFIFIWEI